jgi:BirA family biotin operon repressor/biotin-[acetyl-CoA-carboxylase] ligase
MTVRDDLLAHLADGEVHSGADLARKLDRSRTAVRQHVDQLRALGVDVESLRGRGYCLPRSVELLDRRRIRAGLDAATRDAIESLEVLSIVESTNESLRRRDPPRPDHMHALFAEFQTGGRGRRGRRWLSPFGSGICLSVSWHFAATPKGLPALGLAVGVAVQRALAACGARGLGLKWPNDVVTDRGKLGGLLVDMQGDAEGSLTAVIGVGLNVEITADLYERVLGDAGQPPAALRAVVADSQISRNAVCSALLIGLYRTLRQFSRQGFTGFADDWRRLDRLYGQHVAVRVGDRIVAGIASGISLDGALLLDCSGELRSVVSGEVTLRARP